MVGVCSQGKLLEIPDVYKKLEMIENNILALEEEHYHFEISKRGYETIMELIEKSLIQGEIMDALKLRLTQSIDELYQLTKELTTGCLEKKQQLYAMDYAKFDNVIRSIRSDLQNKKAVFDES